MLISVSHVCGMLSGTVEHSSLGPNPSAPYPTDTHHAITHNEERREHIVDPINHPEKVDYEEHLKDVIQSGRREQDALNPQKYRYSQAFEDLVEDNTHIVAIVLFRFSEGEDGISIPNTYIVTAYQKVVW